MPVMNETPRGRRHNKKTHGATKAAQTTVHNEPQRYASDKKFNFEAWIIPTSAVLTGVLTGLAAPELLDAKGVLGAFKVGLIGTAAAFVSGVVNHYAIKLGAEYAARGFKLAAIGSLVPVVVVGGSAALFSYSGLVLGQTNELNRQEHSYALQTYAEEVNSYAAQIIQLKPVIDSAQAVTNRNLVCEKTDGCLSNTSGGEGTVYAVVRPYAKRADEISKQSEKAEIFRKDQLARINVQLARFEEMLVNNEASSDERHRELARRSAAIKQEISLLKESMPLSLYASYGSDLMRGVEIPGKFEATQNVNAMLLRNGDAITTAVERVKPDKSQSPAFPAKAGVSQAIDRLDDFWVIAMLTFGIELTVPVMLWLLAYLTAVWGIYRHEHRNGEGDVGGANAS